MHFYHICSCGSPLKAVPLTSNDLSYNMMLLPSDGLRRAIRNQRLWFPGCPDSERSWRKMHIMASSRSVASETSCVGERVQTIHNYEAIKNRGRKERVKTCTGKISNWLIKQVWCKWAYTFADWVNQYPHGDWKLKFHKFLIKLRKCHNVCSVFPFDGVSSWYVLTDEIIIWPLQKRSNDFLTTANWR